MTRLRNSLVLLCLLIPAGVIASPRCRSVRQADFRNLIYPLNESGFTNGTKWLRVIKGRYEDREIPTSVSCLYFQVTDVAFGDLTGVAKDEAAVVAIYGSNSGSFYLTDTYVFGCVAGRIKLIGILKQDGIEKDSRMDLQESISNPLAIKNGVLHITYGTEGSRPSPEFTTTFRYRIRKGKLVAFRHPLRRKNQVAAG